MMLEVNVSIGASICLIDNVDLGSKKNVAEP